MKVVMGKMWDSWSGYRILRHLRYLIITPALLGAFICYTILWFIHGLHPNIWTFCASLLVLIFYFIFEIQGWLRQWRSGRFDIESTIRCLGVLFAITTGVWVHTR